MVDYLREIGSLRCLALATRCHRMRVRRALVSKEPGARAMMDVMGRVFLLVESLLKAIAEAALLNKGLTALVELMVIRRGSMGGRLGCSAMALAGMVVSFVLLVGWCFVVPQVADGWVEKRGGWLWGMFGVGRGVGLCMYLSHNTGLFWAREQVTGGLCSG